MGTRHLIEVKSDGITRIAQYGQWDGYLSGQGLSILNFLKRYANKKKWLKALKNCRFFESEEQIIKMYPLIDKPDGHIPPELHRDTGSKILDIVYESKETIYLVNSKDSFWCQYFYCIDMDKCTFTVSNRYGIDKTYNLDNLPTEEEFLSIESE